MDWTKGPVCGIDNCPSDLWRSAAGRTFCRFGHERQNEIEYDHEEDGGTGRKVTMGKLDALRDGEKEEKIWRGPRLYALEVQICQEVVRFYTYWMMQRLNLDEAFEQEVRTLWVHAVKYTDFGLSGYDFEDGTHSEAFEIGSFERLVPCTELALTIVFLGLIRVAYPISFVVIMQWITSGELPFEEVGMRFIPDEALDHMSGSRGKWKSKNAMDLRLRGFQKWVTDVTTVLGNEGFCFSQPRFVIILHTVQALMLPLDIVNRAVALARGIGLRDDLTFTNKESRGMEKTLACVITSARIAYFKSWNSYDSDIKAPFWKLYSELAEIYYQDPQYLDVIDIPAWTDERYNEWLDIYERSHQFELRGKKESLQRKRMLDSFPYQEPSQEPKVTIDDMTQILNEQLVPLPGPVPREIEVMQVEYNYQGPPLYTAVLDAAARAHNLSDVAMVRIMSDFESSAAVLLNKRVTEKREAEKKAARKALARKKLAQWRARNKVTGSEKQDEDEEMGNGVGGIEVIEVEDSDEDDDEDEVDDSEDDSDDENEEDDEDEENDEDEGNEEVDDDVEIDPFFTDD